MAMTLSARCNLWTKAAAGTSAIQYLLQYWCPDVFGDQERQGGHRGNKINLVDKQ